MGKGGGGFIEFISLGGSFPCILGLIPGRPNTKSFLFVSHHKQKYRTTRWHHNRELHETESQERCLNLCRIKDSTVC